MEGFFATRASSGYCDWPQSNAEKRGAVKVKLFPAFICSVATAMINTTVYFFNARRGVRWGRTLRSFNSVNMLSYVSLINIWEQTIPKWPFSGPC